MLMLLINIFSQIFSFMLSATICCTEGFYQSIYIYLKGGYKGDGARFFSELLTDRTRGTN